MKLAIRGVSTLAETPSGALSAPPRAVARIMRGRRDWHIRLCPIDRFALTPRRASHSIYLSTKGGIAPLARISKD